MPDIPKLKFRVEKWFIFILNWEWISDAFDVFITTEAPPITLSPIHKKGKTESEIRLNDIDHTVIITAKL